MFGEIKNPLEELAPGMYQSTEGEGIVVLISALIRAMTIIAGLYAFLNIVLAGYGYISASGDPKAVQKATQKIWQSALGLLVVAGAFLIAGIVGFILYGSLNWNLLFNPKFT